MRKQIINLWQLYVPEGMTKQRAVALLLSASIGGVLFGFCAGGYGTPLWLTILSAIIGAIGGAGLSLALGLGSNSQK